MFFLKSTLDPLSLVSNLDAMVLVSQNQVINEQFLKEAKQSKDYQELDGEQKEFF